MCRVARAIRLAKICSKEFTWSLCRQTDIKKEIERRLAGLKQVAEYNETCQCGRPKHRVTLVKADCSQFFKGASLKRGIDRTMSLLNRIQAAQRYNAIAVERASRRVRGFLCVETKKQKKENTGDHQFRGHPKSCEFLLFLIVHCCR